VEAAPDAGLDVPRLPFGGEKYGEDMDHYALLCLNHHNGGKGWKHHAGWSASVHAKRAPGSHVGWFGVATVSTINQRVTAVVLPRNNMVGPLVEEVKWMNDLKALCFPHNQLSGHIPEGWSSLRSLTNLDLSNNKISGPMNESFFSGMKKSRDLRDKSLGLRSLNLGRNQMWGPLPESLSTLVALSTLNLAHNHFSQALPEALFECKQLKTLRLSANKLSGALPAAFTKLRQLKILELDENELSGEIGPLPRNLIKVHLQGNRLARDLPDSLFKLDGLADLDVSHNYLSGAVSDEIAGLKALRLFHIEGNRHSGAEKALITECIKNYLPDLVRNQGFRI